MKSFKQYISESSEAPDILYHVTSTNNVKSILKNGIIPSKKAGFSYGQLGQRLSKKGYMYAFENLTDAIRWLAKASWTDNGFDLTQYRILKFNDNKNDYEQDTHWESMGGKGRWLMKQGGISPNAINLLPQIDDALLKKLTGDTDIEEKDFNQ